MPTGVSASIQGRNSEGVLNIFTRIRKSCTVQSDALIHPEEARRPDYMQSSVICGASTNLLDGKNTCTLALGKRLPKVRVIYDEVI